MLAALDEGLNECFTAPFGGVALGAGFVRAVMDEARAVRPQAAFILWVDCGDAAGAVMACLREGLTHLCVDNTLPAYPALLEMAESYGASLVPRQHFYAAYPAIQNGSNSCCTAQ